MFHQSFGVRFVSCRSAGSGLGHTVWMLGDPAVDVNAIFPFSPGAVARASAAPIQSVNASAVKTSRRTSLQFNFIGDHSLCVSAFRRRFSASSQRAQSRCVPAGTKNTSRNA
jgi:hypothetical protein